jgi:hypothetical protein
MERGMSDTDWNSNLGNGFGRHEAQDEFFHGTGEPADSLTETWFWNFHVPEAAINCFAYCWVHPTLKVVTSGLMIYKGIKAHHLECELFEIRDFMSMGVLGDGSDIRLPNGMRVQVITPLEHVRFTFEDAQRDTRVDVDIRAMGVPIMRANNKHFEQVMHVTGDLVLRGEAHKVDCLAVRDRSWAEPRPENHNPAPPYTWVTGTFGQDFAFNVGSHDDPARAPDWEGVMEAPARIFNDGWVVVKGQQRRIRACSKITRRTADRFAPVTHDYTFEDEAGDTYHITGELIARTAWGGWSNMTCHLGLVKWSWNGRTGHGESQEVQWNDYVWKMAQRRG